MLAQTMAERPVPKTNLFIIRGIRGTVKPCGALEPPSGLCKTGPVMRPSPARIEKCQTPLAAIRL